VTSFISGLKHSVFWPRRRALHVSGQTLCPSSVVMLHVVPWFWLNNFCPHCTLPQNVDLDCGFGRPTMQTVCFMWCSCNHIGRGHVRYHFAYQNASNTRSVFNLQFQKLLWGRRLRLRCLALRCGFASGVNAASRCVLDLPWFRLINCV